MTEKITLNNGVRIIHENLPHLRSCALGLWVQSGSRHEPEELCGISHFIEHMMFKGTKTRSAAKLASGFDAVGGQVNAFTTKEHTCYYCRTLDEHLEEASELLCDMYFNSKFKDEDADLERSVILEEIGMYEDQPEDLCNEALFSGIYAGQSLGRPILGTKETLTAITGKTLKQYQKSRYLPQNTIVALCGSYKEQDIERLVKYFEGMTAGELPEAQKAQYNTSFSYRKKDTEQNHLIVAFEGVPLGSERRFDMQVLNGILGGGMSSRLFQSVREKSGLCYTVYSFSTSHFHSGVFGIYTALSKDTEKKAIELIKDEVLKLTQKGVTKAELERVKGQIKSNTLMSLESTASRMMTLARNEFVYGKSIDMDEIIEGINAVSNKSVLKLANELFDFSKVSFSAVGKIAEDEQYRALLNG